MSAADTILARLEPVLAAYPDTNGVLTRLVRALMSPVEAVEDIVQDSDTATAWQTIRDPDACPVDWLPWLAQHVGVVLPGWANEAQQRALVSQAAGFYAGTVNATITDVQSTLIGGQWVNFQRAVGGNPWADAITVRTVECPSLALTTAAAMRQKPAGVVRTVTTTSAPFIDQGTRTIDASSATIDTATFSDIT